MRRFSASCSKFLRWRVVIVFDFQKSADLQQIDFKHAKNCAGLTNPTANMVRTSSVYTVHTSPIFKV